MRAVCGLLAGLILLLGVATPANAGRTDPIPAELALPRLGGLLPDGPIRPLEAFGGRLPLLGGLAGRPPVNVLRAATEPGSGLPPGGTPVTDAPPVAANTGMGGPAPTHRPFSPDTRPIAGIDQQYK
jgi:hypothetical protein